MLSDDDIKLLNAARDETARQIRAIAEQMKPAIDAAAEELNRIAMRLHEIAAPPASE